MLKTIGYIVGVLVLVGIAYYAKTLNGFKKLISFEQEVLKNPSDELVQQYIALYKKTFIPNQQQLKDSRARFYNTIKNNDNISHRTKVELRNFLTSKGIELAQIRANEK